MFLLEWGPPNADDLAPFHTRSGWIMDMRYSAYHRGDGGGAGEGEGREWGWRGEEFRKRGEGRDRGRGRDGVGVGMVNGEGNRSRKGGARRAGDEGGGGLRQIRWSVCC